MSKYETTYLKVKLRYNSKSGKMVAYVNGKRYSHYEPDEQNGAAGILQKLAEDLITENRTGIDGPFERTVNGVTHLSVDEAFLMD